MAFTPEQEAALLNLIAQPAKIISDLESLYVEVFKVKTQVTLLNLIEILEIIIESFFIISGKRNKIIPHLQHNEFKHFHEQIE